MESRLAIRSQTAGIVVLLCLVQVTVIAGVHRYIGEDYLSSKKRLEKVLDYRGLEDPPVHEARLPAIVPEYIQTLFDLMDHHTNIASDQSSKSGQTIWGIKPVKVTVRDDHVMLHLTLQTEVLRVALSHAEIVFQDLGKRRSSHRLRHGQHENDLALCTEQTTLRKCVTKQNPESKLVQIGDKVFRVYDITSSFKRWVSDLGKRNDPFTLLIRIPQNGHAFGHFQLSNAHETALVLYANLPTTLLWQHVRPALAHIPSGSGGRRLSRVRRGISMSPSADLSAPVFTPPDLGIVSSSRRSGGTIPTRSNNIPTSFCSVVDWRIDFSDIGWNTFIAAPTSYNAGACVGSCASTEVGHLVNISNHAFIKGLFAMERLYGGGTNRGAFVPTAKCVPLTMSAISVLFVSGNHTIVRRYINDMVVSGCGCL